jgi:[acyl-carrier-protein] S-malonyltransferase
MAKRTVGGTRTIAVSAPADVDLLLESLTDDRHHAPAAGQGDSLHVTERVVVSPAAGPFRPAEGLETGTPVTVGQVIGAVGEHEVVSPFAGSLMGVIALDGQRVMPREPIAWLRTNEETMQ